MNINERIKLQQWAGDMAEQRSSGLTQRKWCNMRGISIKTFEYRCRRVRHAMEDELKQREINTGISSALKSPEVSNNTEPFFAKVELRNEHNTQSGINIRSGDIFVNITPDAPDSHVRMILEVIKSVK